ncbi:MAG: rhodanese-like domain-containing protein [Acidimicrobiales bacterium]|nr:rhodanese-like domain-containing protein [Acidimicrobiales bacterium]
MTVPQISLEEAWETLSEDPDAVLIDVRTLAEWSFVGIPDLTTIGKNVRTVEWTQFPTGQSNPDFLAQATEGLSPEQTLLMLCRSGGRSNAAAELLTAQGYNAVNVGSGFEGDLDPQGHRRGGWKDELPWRQS